jgi:flagellin
MSLTILNSVSSLTAENALSSTQANLQKTLNQLSTGLKINSGSDDAAGLSIATGMQANMAALTQSQQNASNGIGMLQTADGALSQVTSLLNRAVTLATEASNSGITTGVNSQAAALQTEFGSIMSEINQIGNTTDFNGQNVFTSNAPTDFTSTQAGLTTGSTLTAGSKITIADSATGGNFVYTVPATGGAGTGGVGAVSDLITAVNNAVTAGTLSAGVTASINGTGQLEIATTTPNDSITVTSNDAVTGAMDAVQTANTNTVYLSDGAGGSALTGSGNAANNTITTTINVLSAAALGLSTDNLNTASAAQTALGDITSAINQVSAQRGVIGASVNRLTAASSNMNNAVTNLQSATDNIENADIGKTVANMTQYNVLESTGMAALQQSNQAQQAVLKLVQ